ncbi:FadR/GntR family transcriptional regulator [Microbacterium sp. 2MCAF23]|uniref:FadR/GntR family transcriptional regulator n=1 Tax=Microbacterium sp. 2MCAF23 TaxID=3232985 RepID=UPI003F9C32A2
MSNGTRRADVADQLLNGIRSGAYPAGQRLPSERRLSESFGVSRPVVREALGMLSSLGLVDIQIGRGAYVTDKEIAQQSREAERSLIDVTIARETIEAGSIALANRREERPETSSAIREALAELERRVAAGIATTETDHEFHRAIIAAAGSPSLVREWENLTEDIAAVVRVSPADGAMSADILDRHRALAGGALGGDREAALLACHALHEDYRQFLRDLLG